MKKTNDHAEQTKVERNLFYKEDCSVQTKPTLYMFYLHVLVHLSILSSHYKCLFAECLVWY